MAINFPDSPTIGDEFTGGGFTWTWTGTAWEKVVQATSTGTGFTLLVGSSGNTTYSFSSSQASGAYSVTSELSDTTFDIYLVTEDNQNAGYSNASTNLEASAAFNRVVVYGATPNDVLNFEYRPSSAPESSGDVEGGTAPFLTSAIPTAIESVDDTTTVTGGNFSSDVEIVFTGQDGIDRPAKNIVRSSSTSLIVTRPDTLPLEAAPYTMTATNPGITNPSVGVNSLSDYFTVGISVTGGTVTSSGGYSYHLFTSSQDLEIAGSGDLEYLIISGGGGGGGATTDYYKGGGGGGGGAVTGSVTVTTGSYPVVVGAGGGGAFGNGAGGNGSASSIDSFGSSTGGGGGGAASVPAKSGSSGGGGGVGPNGAGASGIEGQGFSGGLGAAFGFHPDRNFNLAGGGGGSAGGGGSGRQNVYGKGGNGGTGTNAFSEWASATASGVDGRFGGGGGGGGLSAGGSGGAGGGGTGAKEDDTGKTAGSANTGGGGGGGSAATANQRAGASGGSGIVIVRYAI